MAHDALLWHTSRDVELAARVAVALREHGIDTKFPRSTPAEAPALAPGETLPIAKASVVLILWTRGARPWHSAGEVFRRARRAGVPVVVLSLDDGVAKGDAASVARDFGLQPDDALDAEGVHWIHVESDSDGRSFSSVAASIRRWLDALPPLSPRAVDAGAAPMAGAPVRSSEPTATTGGAGPDLGPPRALETGRRPAPSIGDRRPEGVGSGWGTPPPTTGSAPLPRAAPSAPSAARGHREAPLSPAGARGALGRAAWHATGVLRGLASVGRRVGRFGRGLSLRRDTVDCTVFAPPRARAPSTVLVQVFLHVPERAAEARASAEDADPGATKRGTQSLSMRLRRGTVVTVNLKGPFIPPEGRSEDVRYDGRTTSATFFVVIPAGFAQDAWFGCATVLVGDPAVPIGRIRFRIAVGGEASSPQPVGEARAHRHAFLSYASPDRPHVARVADSLARAGIDFFQDVLSLEPGEKWRPRLRREIERSDLFVLFWSEAAARSTWVGWEVDEALTRKAGDDEKPPDIVPLTVGGTAPPPPPRLAHVHFGPPERWSVTSGAG